MEIPSDKITKRKPGFTQKLPILALCGAIAFGNISCQKTRKGVAERQEKVENISYECSRLINARKKLVNDYNILLQYPKTESNKSDINESLAQMYEKIVEYDKKIKKLGNDKIKAEYDLNSYIPKVKTNLPPNEPLDPNRWDFLLTI